MPLEIAYTSDGFQSGAPVANGSSVLTTNWNDLLWAAITVGRPNRQYVFKHGTASQYEALFRLSLVRMALEQRRPTARRLRRTTAARTLDPSEKGAVNYFLGLTMCKLFADKLLSVPWLLHLDVFRPQLDPFLTGRSRPDLVGQTTNGSWVALECKGRVTGPSDNAKNRAKQQALRLVSVNGVAPSMHIGGICYFRDDVLQFFWRDPIPDRLEVKNPIRMEIEPSAWRYHYAPVLNLIASNPEYFQRMLREPVLLPVENSDIKVGIHPEVLRSIREGDWEGARHFTPDSQKMPEGITYRRDGIAVVAGESWSKPFDES